VSRSNQTVQDVLENYKSAVYEQDVEKYVSLYASDFHIYDCWDDWECVDRSQWTASTKEWFQGLHEEGVLLRVEFDDVAAEENPSLAFVRCNVTFAAYNPSGEKLRQVTNRFTFGLRKEKDSWTISHQHSSLPINGETGKGIFTRK
jgi:ketosteroid isomerase-like protein